MAKGFLGNSSIFIPTYSNIIGKLQQTKTLNVFVKTIGAVHSEYLVNFNYMRKIMEDRRKFLANLMIHFLI
jgi:hypothetical protein